MSLQLVPEDTTAYLDVAFTDGDGDPAVPSSISYRVDNLTNGREILDWTSVASPAADIEISLTASLNCIVDPSNRRELCAVQVVATYGSGDQLHAQYLYEVANLREPVRPVLVAGDDYHDDDTRALKWTFGGGVPALTDATISFVATRNDTTLTTSGNVETAVGSSKIVRVALTESQTGSLPPGTYRYVLTATLDGTGRKIRLAADTMTVKEG